MLFAHASELPLCPQSPQSGDESDPEVPDMPSTSTATQSTRRPTRSPHKKKARTGVEESASTAPIVAAVGSLVELEKRFLDERKVSEFKICGAYH